MEVIEIDQEYSPLWKTLSTDKECISFIKRPLRCTMSTRYANLIKNENAPRSLKCIAFQESYIEDLHCCICKSLCVHSIRTCRYCEEGIYCKDCFKKTVNSSPRTFKCSVCNKTSNGNIVELNCPRNYVLQKSLKKYLCIQCKCNTVFDDVEHYRSHECYVCNIKCRFCNDMIVNNFNTGSVDDEIDFEDLDESYAHIKEKALEYLYTHKCHAKQMIYKLKSEQE
jgi:hypothetical protein